jgi:hypothetical protein
MSQHAILTDRKIKFDQGAQQFLGQIKFFVALTLFSSLPSQMQ